MFSVFSDHGKMKKGKVEQFTMILVIFQAILSSFPTMNLNHCMKVQNGNVPRLFRAGHQNLGRGKCINKFDEIHNIFYEKSPHLLSISETEICPAAIKKLNDDSYQVETKDDNKRISVIVSDEIRYKRRKDLETKEQDIIWVEMGSGGNKTLTRWIFFRKQAWMRYVL